MSDASGALEHFIGAYLHQDFDLEGDEWGALQRFLGDEGTARSRELVQDIDRLLSRRTQEVDIRQTLLNMGIRFNSEAVGETCREFLLRVRDQARVCPDK
ncbi:contact-dependent growth inhibition system immunity protein [Williamsia sp. Leaf354]|uniref:contact-dependent growth inhibition system immunity protein n=1 Tax=Williamsia sp. Leaf354 TaxID=1736349 RepID=UPI0012E3B799|nr:contact-dependent growth inhibition system immunity protein [Williamsia sp. Leaf354]